jgi:hypothetical protein
VDRRMDQNDVGLSGAKAIGGAPAAVVGAIVCNQERAAGRSIRLTAHNLAN